MAIVTISSGVGAGGPEIGAALATRLGYRYLDREVIAEAASRYGLAEAKLIRLDESKPSLFDRIDAEGRLYVAGIQAVLWEFAQSDDVVLMGRGGQWLLRQIPHALHVRVAAPFEVRVARLAQQTAGETGRTVPSNSPSPWPKPWRPSTIWRRPGASSPSAWPRSMSATSSCTA